MHRLKHLSFCCFILTLSNCDKYSTFTIEIRNNSEDTISIYYTGTTAYTNGVDSVISFPKSDTTYYIAEGKTVKSKNHNCDPQISENEVTIKTSSNRTLIKNISDKENWICETDKKNTFWNMYFVIEESDLR